MRFKKRYLFEIGIILVLGLIPLLWFRGNQVILGHDSGLTLSPIPHFLDRLYAWTDRFSFGVDQSYAIPGFFIHGIEAMLGALGFSLQNIQKISFIFWFVLPGLTMYILAHRIEKQSKIPYMALPASVFFMINHFLLQGWFIAERTKFSLYAALPLLVLFLLDWKDGKRATFRTGVYISLLFFFLNGEASIPLFGGIILTVLLFITFYLLGNSSLSRIKSLALLFFYTGIISFLLQAYWLLPYGVYVTHNYAKEVGVAGGLSGILTWIKYISENSSLGNLFRLQGVPEWYQNPGHPYAKVFLTNPVLLGISYLLPILAFIPLILYQKKKEKILILFIGSLALLSIVFMAGSHPPFGPLYIFLIEFVPGFIAFRTPFYKFASSLWFSYSLLIGFTLSYLVNSAIKSEKIKLITLYVLFPLIILLYNYPFLNGIFFDYIQNQRTMRVIVPAYVKQFGEWSEKKENNSQKTLLLPPPNDSFRVDAFTWGYWSLAPVTSLLTTAPLISTSNYGSEQENKFLSILYEKMEKNDPGWIDIAHFLGITRFLLREDFAWNLKDSPTVDPQKYMSALKNKNVTQLATFDKWKVFSLTDKNSFQVRKADSLSVVVGNVDVVDPLVHLQGFDPTNIFYFSKDGVIPQPILSHTSSFYSYPECINCNLQYSFQSVDLSPPLLTQSSKLYPFVSLLDRLGRKNKDGDDLDMAMQALHDGLSYKDMVIKDVPDKFIVRALSDLQNDLSQFNESFVRNSKKYSNDDLMKRENVFRIIILVLQGERTKLFSQALQNQVTGLISDIQSTRATVSKNMWETTSENEKKYLVQIPKNGMYTISYTSDSQESPVGITIDGKTIDTTYSRESNNGANNSIQLSSGNHKLLITEKPAYAYHNEAEIQLGNSDCFRTTPTQLGPNSFYRLTFNYSTTSDKEPLTFSFLQTGTVNPKGEDILTSSTTKEYSRDFATTSSGAMSFSFCNISKDSKKGDSVENIAFRKITIPQILFYQRGKDQTSSSLPFNKINPTKYEISGTTSPSSVIVLNESYSNQWSLSHATYHFEANGYANGWIVSDADRYEAEYLLQRLVVVGFIISASALIVLCIYLIKRFI